MTACCRRSHRRP